MSKHIFAKILKILIALVLINLPRIDSTNAYFTDIAISFDNTFTAGDWTAPESEVVDNLDFYYNTDFEVDYEAEDFGGGVVSSVDLYYSYSGGDWQYLYTDTSGVSTVSGIFTIDFDNLEGDGEYGFLTIAIDDSGNIENDADENGTLDPIELDTLLPDTFTTVDTTPPVTMLSTPDTMAVANELLYNGGFENGNLDGWTASSSGSEHQVTTEDKKTGTYSALIGFKTATLSAEPAFDSIKQNVSLPSWITSSLSFWYRLMTSDNVSGGFFDAFVIPTGTDPVRIAHDGWDDPEVLETDLDWKNLTYQLNGLEGKDIGIEFKVTQPYENYKTWCYLDDVKLTAATNSATTTTEFSLFSHDGSGADNSTINYSIDGVPQGNYTLPFTLSEGVHSISYSSTDAAGNSETPKQATISATASPVDFGVVLNEFLPNPSGDDDSPKPGGEWVRLYNNSSGAVDVAGWELNDANDGSLTISLANSDNNGNPLDGGETVVPASGTLTVYRNGNSDFTVNDQTETIKLYHGSTLVDSYTYDFDSGLPEGKSLKRDPDGTGAWKDPEAEIPEASEEEPVLNKDESKIDQEIDEKIPENKTAAEEGEEINREIIEELVEEPLGEEEIVSEDEVLLLEEEQKEEEQIVETIENNDELQEKPRADEEQPEEEVSIEKRDETNE